MLPSGYSEIRMEKLRNGNGGKLVSGQTYLWRVAARHPTFGEGPFSPAVRVTFEHDAAKLARINSRKSSLLKLN